MPTRGRLQFLSLQAVLLDVLDMHKAALVSHVGTGISRCHHHAADPGFVPGLKTCTHRDHYTHTHTHTHTGSITDRHTDTHRVHHRQTDMHTQGPSHTYSHTETHTGSITYRQTHRHTHRVHHRQTQTNCPHQR